MTYFTALSMFDTFLKTLAWSFLFHLLVVIGILWSREHPAPKVTTPKTIEAFIYQPVPHLQRSTAKSPLPEPIPAKSIPALSEVSDIPKTPAPPKATARKMSKASLPKTTPAAVSTAATPVVTMPVAPKASAIATTDLQQRVDEPQIPAAARSAIRLSERSLAIATRHQDEVSTAVLAASQLRPELRDRPATTSRPQQKPAHAAANVISVLSDGSFIEKVGDYCYLATPGADLRADISSMKPVSCGEDKNAAMFRRIMSKVGQDR